MIDMEAKLLIGLFAVLSAVLLLPATHAVPSIDFMGNVTINVSGTYNLTPSGASLTVHINGSDTINATMKVGVRVYFGSTATEAPGMYLVSVPCNLGDNISFRIYNVTALINNTWSGYSCSGPVAGINTTHLFLNISALQNGSFCSDSGACISNRCGPDYDGIGSWCVPAGTCAHNSVVYANGAGVCTDIGTVQRCNAGSWETVSCSCLGGFCVTTGAGTTPAPAPTPTPTPNITITDQAIKQEVIQGISPSDLGLTTLTASDVTVTQIGPTVETTVQTTATIADLAIQMATDAAAKAAIEAVKDDVAAGNDVDVKVSMTVYKIESPSTGQFVYVSKVTLSFTAANYMKDVDIIQIIPKGIAATIAEVTFLSGTPAVLQSDPIVKWSFASVSSGETKSMSYTVKKQLSDTSVITTLAAAGEITAKPPVVCIAGNKRCSEGNLQECSADGSGWQATKTCDYGCDEATSQCKTPSGVTPQQESGRNILFVFLGLIIAIAVVMLIGYAYKKKR